MRGRNARQFARGAAGDGSARSRVHRGAAALVLACLSLASAHAQNDDVPLPPRIDRTPSEARAPNQSRTNRAPTPATRSAPRENRGGELLFEIKPQDLIEADAQPLPSTIDTFVRPPNAARLAPVLERRRSPDGVEEIIVLGGNWRLPDLGSRWRARQEAAESETRVTLLPLYDPERPTTFNNTYLLNREVERIGFIDLFKVRFGRRSKDDDDAND